MNCFICGRSFVPRAKTQRLCGQRECRLQEQRIAMAERDRRYREQHGVSYFDRFKVDKTCPSCGETFRTRPEYEVCGNCQRRRAWRDKGAAAAGAARRVRAEERRVQRGQVVLAGPVRRAETLRFRSALDRLERAARGTRPRRVVWAGCWCSRCGTSFVCMVTNDLPKYCSPRCLRSETKVARRARQRGGRRVPYRRIDIFERDGWRCRIDGCGKPVKRRAKVPDPKAPVIDHIVPLAAGPKLGGVDAPWNVQCAHFLCNSIKSASFTQPALALEVA